MPLSDMIPRQMIKPPTISLEDIKELTEDLNLSPLRTRYVFEYAKTGKYAEALRNAGSKASGRNIYWQVYHFNKNPKVKEALRRVENYYLEKIYLQAEAIKISLGKIAFSDVTNYINWTEDSVELKPSEFLLKEGIDTTPIKSISVSHTKMGRNIKIDFYDKLEALKTLAKISGILTDKVEHTGAGGGPILITHEIRSQLHEVYGSSAETEMEELPLSTPESLEAAFDAEFEELPAATDEELEEAEEFVMRMQKNVD